MSATPAHPRFLTIPEAAEIMRLSAESVRDYTTAGILPYVRWTGGGSKRLIPVDALEAFIAARTVHGGAR